MERLVNQPFKFIRKYAIVSSSLKEFVIYNFECSTLLNLNPSSESRGVALDEEYASTYFLATSKGWFLVVFSSLL